ncbi:MAG: phenylacetate--CoA ligase family protein [Flavobacterium sp.]|uniref:phenylacetate--CoA ligase family protein n=1 Tax=Flavobacterium sp. Leaf359 TaxID=1736351 RepID=UPI0006FEF45C|nr:phenylacetate--CoA ligase family protein [Flavobacterium sp. Leaf359]KQS52744.1 AMP-binding protein [Flavobacterium sp. Leaf359]MBU7569332.1 phenylacetate--CoA ligase family protein [Flavobacterium sp.]PZO33439.1 MAG: phenylacetate--CoA ligase family protein [Flavobacteriaceae bacterium]
MFKLFDFSLKISGFPIDEARLEFDNILEIPEANYESYILGRRKQIVDYHLKNNSFYRQLASGKTSEQWDALPILTKKELQQPLDLRLSQGFTVKNVFVNKTSGSSGDPFIFAKDNYSHAMTWASNMYRFGWYGIDFNSSYQARFYGIPLDFIGNKKERLKDFLSHRFRFPIFDLSDPILENFLGHFKRKKFDYINGYTSSIVLFAKYLERKNLILKNICPTLKVCIITSEMLFEKDKKLMEKQFGVPVVNEYGASELDLIAFENQKGEWQVNAETLFVEILDDDGQPVPYGTQGRVVITSLYNKAHPFIRYDIGDIGILDEKSTFKNPILKQLTGRTNDVAVLPSGKKAPGLTFYYVTKSIIEDDGNVKEFIIKQTSIDSFEVDYISEAELTLEQIAKIEAAISLYLEPNLKFKFIRKSSLARTNRGKLKQFQSLLRS